MFKLFNSKTSVQELREMKQVITYSSTFFVVKLLVWSFFSILIYEKTNSIAPIFLALIFYAAGKWVAFIISSFVLERLGILKVFRLSFFLQAMIAILIGLTLNHFVVYYLLFSLVRGLAEGVMYPASNYFMLNDIHGGTRSTYINLSQSLNIILSILVPILAGSLIDFTGTYQYSFFLAAALNLLAALMPFKSNHKPQSKIRSAEISKLLKNRAYMHITLLTFVEAFSREIILAIMSIVPFLLIGSEFGVGALSSLAGIAAAIGVFAERANSLDSRSNVGKWGFGLAFLANVILSVFWTIPILIIHSLINKLSLPFGQTARADMYLRLIEKALGDFRNESAIEVNLLRETSIFLARVTGLALVYFVLQMLSFQSLETLLRGILPVASLAVLLVYIALKNLSYRNNFH